MASTYSDLLKIELIGDGEQSGSWGTTTNNNLKQSVEHSIAGVLSIAITGDVTLTTGDGPQAQADNQARQACIIFTGSAVATVTVPATQKIYHIYNDSSAIITLRISGGTTDFVLAAATSYLIACTGSAWHALNDDKVHFAAAGTISNTSGDITIDSAADIVLDGDGADILLKDAGTQYAALTNSSGNLIIKSGSTTAATFSGANVTLAGTVASGAIDTAAANITSGGVIKIDVDADADDLTGDSATGRLTIGAGEDLNLYHGGTNSYIVNDTGDLILDTAGDIILDADGADVVFKDGGTAIGTFTNSSSDFVIASNVSDKDMIFKGNDGGSTITALTLDMSAAGAATFNNDVTAFSDERLKTDIKTIDNALNMVGDMRGVYFNRDGVAGTGVIAQEIQDILPEVVHDKQEYLSVAYGNMVGVLIEAIKELKKEVETLKESR
jgi:hypothetical protein|tara:strand:- start:468 stop:1793 length:1326 start_codon:yes stop_codon:yes gene_type:complete